MAKTRNSGGLDLHGGRMRVPRSRGALSGALLIILGAWGALIPFVGPYVDFGYTPNATFELTRARFLLELLPGAVAALGGLLLLVAANRLVTSFGAWLAVAGGAWFIVGPTLDGVLSLGSIGSPIRTSTLGATLENLLLFDGIGAVILFLGALAVGRLGVVSVGDVRSAQRREQRADDDERRERAAHFDRRSQPVRRHDDTDGPGNHADNADNAANDDSVAEASREPGRNHTITEPDDAGRDPRRTASPRRSRTRRG